jgi:hypothetical protein
MHYSLCTMHNVKRKLFPKLLHQLFIVFPLWCIHSPLSGCEHYPVAFLNDFPHLNKNPYLV